MGGSLLSLLLDIVVLLGLGVTIFYCIRLTKALNNFRQYRQEFGTLVHELSKNIDKANSAIAKLKDASFEAGEDLQKVVNNARGLCDELQLMNDMGNSLANRLERASENARHKEPSSGAVHKAKAMNGQHDEMTLSKSKKDKNAAPSFFIQDRDFDDREESDDNYYDEQGAEPDHGDDFESEAERELYEALQQSSKGQGF